MLYRNSTEVKNRPASDLYEPMIDTFKLSAFWVGAGNISMIRDPELFRYEMERLIAGAPLIEGMTVRDESGCEIEAFKDTQKRDCQPAC